MIENWSKKFDQGGTIVGTYAALRFFDSIYIGWSTGEKEFYDLSSDPCQLDLNQCPSSTIGYLEHHLRTSTGYFLRRCPSIRSSRQRAGRA